MHTFVHDGTPYRVDGEDLTVLESGPDNLEYAATLARITAPDVETREPDSAAARRYHEWYERETDEATRLQGCF